MNNNHGPSHGGLPRQSKRVVIEDKDCVCSACGSSALDTGFECDDCGHDMMPEMLKREERKS